MKRFCRSCKHFKLDGEGISGLCDIGIPMSIFTGVVVSDCSEYQKDSDYIQTAVSAKALESYGKMQAEKEERTKMAQWFEITYKDGRVERQSTDSCGILQIDMSAVDTIKAIEDPLEPEPVKEMKQAIYKYEIPLQSESELEIKGYFTITKVGVQNNKLYAWATVYPESDEVKKVRFKVLATGEEFYEKDLGNYGYIDSVLLNAGEFVFHIFIDDGE